MPLHITLLSPDPHASDAFYADILGLNAASRHISWQRGPCESGNDQLFWKTGVCVANLDAAWQYLRDTGVSVSEPQPFEDIGLMCHLQDPAGYTIELLQHSATTGPAPTGHPIGSQGHLAHLTLRANRTAAVHEVLAKRLGVTEAAHINVVNHAFSLLFFAEQPLKRPARLKPGSGPWDWLWQHPDVLLEVQVRDKAVLPGRALVTLQSAAGTVTLEELVDLCDIS